MTVSLEISKILSLLLTIARPSQDYTHMIVVKATLCVNSAYFPSDRNWVLYPHLLQYRLLQLTRPLRKECHLLTNLL